MRTIIIDCAGTASQGELWRRYLEAAAPEDADRFGCNLHAFWDAVEAGGPGWPGEVALAFIHTEALRALRLADGSSFLDQLRRIAREATATRITLE
jgi:RNAse (barnase) inhibitor barstar